MATSGALAAVGNREPYLHFPFAEMEKSHCRGHALGESGARAVEIRGGHASSIPWPPGCMAAEEFRSEADEPGRFAGGR